MQAVATAANEAATVEEATRFCLDRVCAHTGWPVGHAYALAGDGTGGLVPTAVWQLAPRALRRLPRGDRGGGRRSRALACPAGSLASGRPAWSQT